MQKRFVHETADQCFWIAFFGNNDFYDFLASLVKDGVTLRKCYLFSFWKLYDRFFLYYISADKPQSSLSLKSIVTVELAAQNAHWSNFTLQSNANTFVKVDAQIGEECRADGLSPICKDYSCPKRFCKKLNNQKPTAKSVRNTRRTTLIYAKCAVRLKNFLSSNLQ